MTIPAEQSETAGMLRRLTGTAPHETPISAVFVGPDTVFKLRKAVRLPFLDFSTATRRERFARREFELNAPHAPGLYRRVRAVVPAEDGSVSLADEPDGRAIDWVVEMALVPPGDFLDDRAEAGGIDPPLLDAIADAVARYHDSLKPMRRDQRSAMSAIADGNVASALAAGLDADAVRDWHADMIGALESRARWLAAREAAGFVRRTHGDLHLGNLCMWQGKPVPFDALEFDENLAVTDVAYDLAFLLMDTERRLGRASANRVLNRYLARTGDSGLVGGFPPFLSMRAMVRAHVETSGGGREAGLRYLAMAKAALAPAKALVVAIGGLPGTGKSTYARLIAPGLGAPPGAVILRSDEIRKRLNGVAPEQRLPQAAYHEGESRRVFETIMAQAREIAGFGHCVVADATFLDPGDCRAIADAARVAGAGFAGLWLSAPLDQLESRVAARSNDASDATVDVLHRIAGLVKSGPPPGWEAIDTTDREAALAKIKDALNGCDHAC